MDLFYRNNPNLRRAGSEYGFTKEQWEEYKRCYNDPIYFIENYVHVVHLDKGFVLMKLYPFQKEIIRSFHENRKTVVWTPRQIGKSTVMAAYFVWCVTFRMNYAMAILANKAATAREILSRVQRAYESLPIWMQQGVKVWNKGSLELENGSSIMASSTSSSAIRGYSFNCVKGDTKVTICDDYERIFHIDIEKANSSKYKYNEDNKINGDGFLYYTVYKITNKINGKIYVGYHATNDLDDGYMGSGKLIKRAVEHYGIEAFEKEYIEIFDNREDAEALEATIVNEEWVLDDRNYNLSLGGNVCILSGERNGFYGKTHSDGVREYISSVNVGANRWEDDDIIIDGIRYNSYYHAKNELGLSNLVLRKKILEDGNGYVDNNKQKNLKELIELQEERNRQNKEAISMRMKEKMKDYVMSETTRKKLSESKKGHKKSKEWSDKINKNPEKIEKTRQKHLGSKRTEESKKRMSEAKKGKSPHNKGKKYCYNPDTLETKLCFPEEIPEGFIKGFIPKKLKRNNG